MSDPDPEPLKGKGTLYENGEKVVEVRYVLSETASDDEPDASTLTGTISSGGTVVDFRSFFLSDALTLELEDGTRFPFVFEDPRAGTIRTFDPDEND